MQGAAVRGWSPRRAIALAIAAVASCVLAPGCGPSLYVFDILPASSAVHQAEAAGAAEWAPYEYWSAHEYLEAAAEEADEGNYQDAIRFAERAKDLGQAAQARTAERIAAAGQ